MSWVRAAMEKQQEGDKEEVFDEEGDEMSLLQREWRRSMEKRLKEGYRDGIDAGKETSLQKGFNHGYKLGVERLMPCGKLRGTISALQTWCSLHNPESENIGKLTELLTAVRQFEEHLVKCLYSSFQEPHPSELSSAMEDMGLSSLDHGGEMNNQSACISGMDCSSGENSCSSSSLGDCRTAQQHSDLGKRDLDRILKETLSIAEQLGIPASLLSQL